MLLLFTRGTTRNTSQCEYVPHKTFCAWTHRNKFIEQRIAHDTALMAAHVLLQSVLLESLCN
jgi:hypothetical protein